MLLRICRGCTICILLGVLLFVLAPVGVHADGGAPNLAYVSGTGKGISVIDVMQQKVSGTIDASGDPHGVALSLDGRFLYVAEPLSGQIVAIGARAGNVFCQATVPGQPTLLVLDPNNSMLYAAGNEGDTVSAIDATNCAVKHVFHVNGVVNGIAFAAVGGVLSKNGNTGDQLWVGSANTLTIFDENSYSQVGQVAVPGTPHYLVIPAGATVYATTKQGGVVAVDLNTHAVTPLISGGDYGPMDYDAGTGEIYVPDMKNNELAVLAPVNSGFAPPKEPSRVISVSGRPVSIAITSDGQLGFAALEGGNVAMLDIPGHGQLISTIKVGGNPRFIITGLYPPALGSTPQQASILQTVVTVAAYAIVAALLIVPIILFRRYAKPHTTKKDFKQ